jgi:hypothetical protein
MMPAVSEKQKKFMDAAANNPAFAKQANIPIGVAKEFSEKSKGMKFGKGSNAARPDLQKVNKPKTLHGKMSLMKEGGDTMATKKMANGGMPMKDGKPAFIGDGKGAMKNGGISSSLKAHASASASKAHAGMKNGGMAPSKMGAVKTGKTPNGVASKGKTKGTMVKMKMGGKAC